MPKSPAGKIIQLSQQYGGIYSLKMARQRYVVIADAPIAEELLVTRAATTSSREASYITSRKLWAGDGSYCVAAKRYLAKAQANHTRSSSIARCRECSKCHTKAAGKAV